MFYVVFVLCVFISGFFFFYFFFLFFCFCFLFFFFLMIRRPPRSTLFPTRRSSDLRRTREAVAAGDAQLAESELRLASQKLDRAAQKKIIHRNQAANRKSKLAKLVNSMEK